MEPGDVVFAKGPLRVIQAEDGVLVETDGVLLALALSEHEVADLRQALEVRHSAAGRFYRRFAPEQLP